MTAPLVDPPATMDATRQHARRRRRLRDRRDRAGIPPAETELIPPTPAAAVVEPGAAPVELPVVDGCARVRGFYPC